jgi:hypothetical protein
MWPEINTPRGDVAGDMTEAPCPAVKRPVVPAWNDR